MVQQVNENTVKDILVCLTCWEDHVLSDKKLKNIYWTDHMIVFCFKTLKSYRLFFNFISTSINKGTVIHTDIHVHAKYPPQRKKKSLAKITWHPWPFLSLRQNIILLLHLQNCIVLLVHSHTHAHSDTHAHSHTHSHSHTHAHAIGRQVDSHFMNNHLTVQQDATL